LFWRSQKILPEEIDAAMAQDVMGRRDAKKELPRFAADDCRAMTGLSEN
jgi:hypothetical protein